MNEPTHPKDPTRVRLGRLGALTVHARGRTNTGPAREAWEARLAAEAGIPDDVTPAERARRMDYALRAQMTRLAEARWAGKRGRHATARPNANQRESPRSEELAE